MNIFNIMISSDINTADIDNLAGTIEKYGFIPVILAGMILVIGVFIGYIIYNNKKYTNQITDLFNKQIETTLELLKERDKNLTDQNNMLLEKITNITDEKTKEVKTERNLVNIFMRLNSILKDECHQVQEKFNAIRVGVYACHNNTTTNTGLPFFKISCISEWISKNNFNSGGIGVHTDLQLGIFYNLVKQIVEEGYCVIYNIQESKMIYNSMIRKYMNNLGAVSSIIVPIINDEDHHIGSVTIEFNEPINKDQDISSIITECKNLAEKIIPLLDYSLYDEDVIEDKNYTK